MQAFLYFGRDKRVTANFVVRMPSAYLHVQYSIKLYV